MRSFPRSRDSVLHPVRRHLRHRNIERGHVQRTAVSLLHCVPLNPLLRTRHGQDPVWSSAHDRQPLKMMATPGFGSPTSSIFDDSSAAPNEEFLAAAHVPAPSCRRQQTAQIPLLAGPVHQTPLLLRARHADQRKQIGVNTYLHLLVVVSKWLNRQNHLLYQCSSSCATPAAA